MRPDLYNSRTYIMKYRRSFVSDTATFANIKHLNKTFKHLNKTKIHEKQLTSEYSPYISSDFILPFPEWSNLKPSLTKRAHTVKWEMEPSFYQRLNTPSISCWWANSLTVEINFFFLELPIWSLSNTAMKMLRVSDSVLIYTPNEWLDLVSKWQTYFNFTLDNFKSKYRLNAAF